MHVRIRNLGKDDVALHATIDETATRLEGELTRLRDDLTPRSTSKAIRFGGNAFLFNSWDHQTAATRQRQKAAFIDVWGSEKGNMDWVVSDNGRIGAFHFSVNESIPTDRSASAGGYIIFYDDPRDRLRTQAIRFRCKTNDANDPADIGIRLVVDNPRSEGDRELATYQFSSVASLQPITSEWQTFQIDVAKFSLLSRIRG
jgi:hypothetical protein